MELRRAADAILRSQPTPLTAFLVPSMRLRWQSVGIQNLNESSRRCLNRGISTTSRRYAESSSDEPPETKAPAVVPSTIEKSGKQTRTTSSRPSTSRSLNNLFESSDSKTENRPQNGLRNPNNSATELLNAFKKQQMARGTSIDASRMAQPPSKQGTDMMASLSRELNARYMVDEPRIPIRLTPAAGRTIEVTHNLDVGRAFQVLARHCAKNQVKNLVFRQRFHERPGLKRKRQRRERWRKKFRDGFKATVARVKELKKQGW